jgi:hypothetical protein
VLSCKYLYESPCADNCAAADHGGSDGVPDVGQML